MANTEKMKALKALHEAKLTVREARFEASIPGKDRAKLERLYTYIDKLEDDLILGELDESIESLEKSSKKIKEINEKIRETNKDIEGIADIVDKAADVVSALASMAKAAASSGLLG
jgi:superfamily I DNA/RNA helicase